MEIPSPDPSTKVKSRWPCSSKLTNEGLKTLHCRMRSLWASALESNAELARGPALCQGTASWGRAEVEPGRASRGNAVKEPTRVPIRREKFFSLFNPGLIYSFSLPRIFDKGEKCCPCIWWQGCPIYQTRALGSLPLLPPPRVFVFEALLLLCTTRKGKKHEEFYLLTVPETMWNPSTQSGADRSVLSLSRSLPHTSPRPRAPSFQRGRAGRCAPSPSLLLIGAQVGESPPRAYVRVRAVRAHLAFELRRFWLWFTSLPAFSARCRARQGSSRKAKGGGRGPGRRHRRKETQRRRRCRGREGGASCPSLQITWPLNPRDSGTWAPASGADSPQLAALSSPALPAPITPLGPAWVPRLA